MGVGRAAPPTLAGSVAGREGDGGVSVGGP